ncbi:MAG: amino acid adenylation domain-containing protein [Ignavibacteria bacterium]|nr:amino acid adenylation domain-containing protein [Ignavibacteria bacterium]
MKNISNAIDILQHAKINGVHIYLDKGQLRVKYSKGNGINPQLLEEIKSNKELITRFLKDNESYSSKEASSETDLLKIYRDPAQRIPLSFSQERLWFIDQLEGSVQYHIPSVLRFKGKLNIEALKYSLQSIINRHEVLRTVILQEEGKAYQCIKDEYEWNLGIADGSVYKEDKEELKKYIQSLINAAFNLSEDHMIRADLINLSEEENVLVVTMHHIASDGWSFSVLVKEVMEFYRAFEEGKKPGLAPLQIQYADYAIWQRKYLEGENLDRKLDYWKKKLEDVALLQLPIDYKRPSVQSTRGAACSFSIDKLLSVQLQELSRQQGATLFMTLLAVFKILLHRYSSQQDICVGTVIAGRQQEVLNGLIGFFVNTLALRSEIGDDASFIDTLQQVRRTTMEAQEHQDVPFEKVVDAVVKERSLSRSPLFQVMLILQNTPDAENLVFGEVQLTQEEFVYDTTKFELTFSFKESAHGLYGTVEYCTDLYSTETIWRMIGHFMELLHSVVKTPGQSIGLLSMLTKSETRLLLEEFNDTAVEYPKNKTIIDLFEEQVLKTPENIAVVFEDQQLTYRELSERSNQLAHYLQTYGVKPETLVPICIGRSIEMITGILGILKSGGAYVPVDPEYPEERINFMLEDTDAFIVVSSKANRSKIPAAENIEVIELDTDRSKISKQPKDRPEVSLKHDQLAYVIYTSGSTGRPKGVMIDHKNVYTFLSWCRDEFKSSPFDIAYASTSMCFDLSVYEMFFPLTTGKPIRVLENGLEIGKYLSGESSVMINCVPGVIESLLKNSTDFTNASVINMAGEPISIYVQQNLDSDRIEVRNLYGPSEDTTYTTNYRLIKGQPLLIGKPIANTEIYILSKNDQPVPVNVPGEICISGDGVARGYLNREELTAEKFVKNPFKAGERMYRTGDLGRWLPDGNIDYLGRMDNQVKVRGYRIELGEIENVLQECGSVRQSVVMARETTEGSRRLVGYVVPEGDFDREAIMFYLSKRLPAYMVPALWVELESLPVTQNGKIDRKALPDPDASELIRNEYAAPRNETEENLASIWKELLHVERVGIHDNFFELGGDSVITIQVVSRARRLGYELKPKDIFIHQTIGSLSSAMSERSEESVTGEQGLLKGISGLLPIQQWYFEGAVYEGSHYNHFNQSVLLSIDKTVTQELLSKAVKEIMSHHDALRFRYNRKDGNWEQEYGTNTGELITVDLHKSKKDVLITLIGEHAEKYQRSLDIEKGELVRFVLMKTPEEETHNRILIVIHHLAIDGVSWRILLDDLELLLSKIQNDNEAKADLGIKSSSYRQWHEALSEYGKSKRLQSQIPYWEKAAGSYSPLPVDKTYTGFVREKDISSQTLRLDKAKTRQLLQEVPKVYHTEINDILLCSLALTLCEWSGRDSIVIGMEGHGREIISESTDTSRTAGWFTSLYPLLLEINKEVNKEKSISDLIKSVKEQLRRLPDKGLGYGVLKYINKEERLTKLRGKAWEIVFNYLGQLDNVVSSGKWLSGAGESGGTVSSHENTVDHLLSVSGMVTGDELILNWSYSSLHYEKETIEELVKKFQINLESVISHCIEQQKAGSVYTPSDYGLEREISYEELDRFMEAPYRGKPRRESAEGLYRLSGLQQGMLFHALYDSGVGAYTEQLSCELISPDLEIIKKSWNEVLRRHSILRSGFYYDEFSVPVQCVYRDVELPVTILDYSDKGSSDQTEAIKEYESSDRKRGFDFSTVPLMHIALIKMGKERYRMLWTSHHILFDGWSLPILMEEFLSTYEELISGKKINLIEEDRYEDYIRYIERIDKDNQETYWRSYMEGVEQGTLLPFISATSQRTKGAGVYETEHLKLDTQSTSKASQYVQRHRITINTLIQGAWSYLLHRYTGSKDVVYGIVVSGRPEDLPDIEQRVGLYINTLPLHSKLYTEQNKDQWLQEIQDGQLSSSQYQFTPLHDIQRWTGISGDLFDSLLVFENYPVSELVGSKQWKLRIENLKIRELTNYPLTIIINSAKEINISFSYNTEILKQEYVKEIRGHFENVLLQMITNESRSINEIKILTKAEEQQLLSEFNDTAVDYPKDKTIIDLFEEQVLKTPDNIALVFEDNHLTYRELNERSNQLAHYLRSQGVKTETLVPICIGRSIEMIIGILGILKAGGAYVPVDPDYPEERIKYILEDTGANVIIAGKEVSTKLTDAEDVNIIEIDGHWSEISAQPKDNLQTFVQPDNLAYIIYTSGSTGKPKGVMIAHNNIVSLFKTEPAIFDFNEKDVWAMFHSFCFDFSVWEMYGALFYGGRLVIVPKHITKDASLFSELLISEKVTVLNQTPSSFYVLQDILAETVKPIFIRYVIFGGEALNPSKLQAWKQTYPACKLINMYGITETTVHVTYTEIEWDNIRSGKSIIGKPIPSLGIYILDSNQNLLPTGIAGELCIKGAGLSRGYLNLPELTSEKFIKDPFSEEPGARLYRSGDLGMRSQDGNIEYLGRIDEQVKIRGFRIELGERESVLQEINSVRQSVVLARDTKEGGKRLVGYVVPEGDFDKEAIMIYLSSRLPEYMVPALWVELESLPLTQNGKIDRKALPDPDASELISNEYAAPRNETEESLAEIWKKLLGIERAGIYDNFFELGGHSLLATRAVSLIRKEFSLNIPIKVLFEFTCIADLSNYIALIKSEQEKEIDSEVFDL